MKKYTQAISEVRNSHLRSVFLLFFAGALACTADSELPTRFAANGGVEPVSDPLAEPGEPGAGPIAEGELFVLLSMEEMTAVGSEQTEPLMALSADINSGVDLGQVEGILQQPTTKSVSLARVEVSAFKANSVQMSLSGNKKLRASRKHFETLSEDNFIWAGEVPGAVAMSTFVVRDGNVTGSIRDENNVLYSIQPVGGGVHALTQLDEAAFSPEARPLQEHMEDMKLSTSADMPYAFNANPVEIDVLVAYTPAARRARSDIESVIRLAVAETNQTYKNSGINIQLTLVASYEFNYTERAGESGWNRMIEDFAVEFRNRRAASGADVGMLIINERTYCGLAYVYPGANNAVGLVDQSCATGRYTFGHEVGHIQGASHNEHIENRPVFSYGHGYIYSIQGGQNNFSTVMSYDWGAGCAHGCPRIPYWSNPNIRHNGIPTGTVSRNDNARVLNETAQRIAGFNKRPGGGGEAKPLCTLTAPVASIPGAGGTYSFDANCSNTPSSYTWTVDGVGQAETGKSLRYTFPANNSAVARSFTIALTAANNAGTSDRVELKLAQPSNGPAPIPVCRFSAPTMDIPHTGGVFRISVSCSNNPLRYEWTVDKEKVAGTETLSHRFLANETPAVRSFKVAVTAANNDGTSVPVEMTVNQEAAPQGERLVCKFGNEEFARASIPQQGGLYSISVTCTPAAPSYEWTVNNQRQGGTGRTILYAFPANNTTLPRTFEVLATGRRGLEMSTATLLVTQAGRR